MQLFLAASPILALLAAAAAQDPPQPASHPVEQDPLPILTAGDLTAEIDYESGSLALATREGERIVEVPLGFALRPSSPLRRYRSAGREEAELVTTDEEEGQRPELLAVHLQLRADGVESPAAVGLRLAKQGAVLMYGVPYAAMRDLALPAGNGRAWRERTSAGGGRAVAVAAPARLALRAAIASGGREAGSLRLRGRLAVADGAPAGSAGVLRIGADGVALHRTEPAGAGGEPIAFDVALPDAREYALELESGDGGPAELLLLDCAFVGAAESALSLGEVLERGEPGIDLLSGEGGGPSAPGGLVPLGEPFDVAAAGGAGGWLGPLLLPYRAEAGFLVGIGFGLLPDARRAAASAGGVRLDLPTRLYAAASAAVASADGGDTQQARLPLFIVVGRSNDELLQRYRELLIEAGYAPALRELGALSSPAWWRLPLLLVGPGDGASGNPEFEAFAVEKAVREVEERLGLDAFNVAVDGGWNELAGDPLPSARFADLRAVIAAQHVRGRQVLLRWNLIEAAPDSLADLMGAAEEGAVSQRSGNALAAFLHEVAQRCLEDDFSGLGADGFLIAGLDRVREPSARGSIGTGTGLREIAGLLEPFDRAVHEIKEDALLLAPAALPQFARSIGGVLVRGAPAAGEQDQRIAIAAAAVPELPLAIELRAGDPAELLSRAARAVAAGIPVVPASAVAMLDDEQARALGALLALTAERRLGRAVLGPTGCSLRHGDVVLAEELPGGAGVAVYPGRDRALVALARTGDVRLPFAPDALDDADGAAVLLDADGSVLTGGRPGRIYRFRR